MTLPQMIRDRHGRWRDQRCMMVKQGGTYRDVTWAEFYGRAERVATALVLLGFEAGDRGAIIAPTSAEWAVADTAILTAGGVTVPIYPSLPRNEVKSLLERSRAKIAFVNDADQFEKCRPLLDQIPDLDHLVVFAPHATTEGDDHIGSLATLERRGNPTNENALEERLAARGPDDVATILFTSGTTGHPKGVPLTHRNLLSNIEAGLEAFDLTTADISLAHLPVAHILERTGGYYLMLYAGATIGYAESIRTVSEDFALVRPTVAVTVPRIFEKVYGGIQAKAADAPAPIRALTFWALRTAREAGAPSARGERLPLGLRLRHRLADRLVFRKIRAKLGGRIRFFISGGAPLSPELARTFEGVGVRIYEGYGLTETSPVIALNTPARRRIGTVGPPLPNLDVKIADDGEILVKGPSVFRGYHEDPAADAEAFTPDGYFRTGDVGELDSNGCLRITDRKKDIIVTAGGKNVAPQKIENILKLSKYIDDVMLYGDEKKFVSALVVPDFGWLARYAEGKGLGDLTPAEVVRHPTVTDFYERLLLKIQARAQLASFESVKKFVLLDHEFTAAQGEVTPTLKTRRRQVTEHYRRDLDALYLDALYGEVKGR